MKAFKAGYFIRLTFSTKRVAFRSLTSSLFVRSMNSPDRGKLMITLNNKPLKSTDTSLNYVQSLKI